MQKKLRRRVVELFGMHRADDADIIDHGTETGKETADPLATLAMLGVVEYRPHHLWLPLDEGEAFAFEIFVGADLAVILGQGRLVLKQIKL